MTGARGSNRRRRGRELALRVLFELEGNDKDADAAIAYQASELGATADIAGFATRLVAEARDHDEEIDALLSSTSTHWSLTEAGKVERTALRLGTAELTLFPETPFAVAINEWVEITKTYAGEEGAHFVNGVLGEVWRMSEARK